jgi:hypothetical protein
MTGPITAGWDTVEDLRGQFLNNGRYRLLDLLGLGGPSEVWLAHDTQLDRQVAIKTLRADAGGGWDQITAHEARALAQIDHPHVVPIYDSFAERDKSWIVMRFIRGRTLADILNTDGPLPEAKLWDVARALSSALAASHRAGIVHRDLKPANVMIGHDSSIWLVDFGIALRGRAGEVTPPPQVVGTLAYMAPESLSGRPDRPADLWSLGVLLLTLAIGANPFQRPDPMATAGAILHGPIPDLPVPSLQAVVRRLLQRNPVRRPTADQLAADLRAGMPDRIAPHQIAPHGIASDRTKEAAGSILFRRLRRLWPENPDRRAFASEPAPAVATAMPATRADPLLARSGMAYWGMSRVIDQRLDSVQPRQVVPQPLPRPIATSQAPEPGVRRLPIPGVRRSLAAVRRPLDAAVSRSPVAVRHATVVALPVLGGWAQQTVVAFAGFWLGLLCLAPVDLPLPPLPVIVLVVAVAVAAACLSAGRPRASSGPWLTITTGWAVLLSVGMTTTWSLGAIAIAVVTILTLAGAVGVNRACSLPAPSADGGGSTARLNAGSTVTAFASALAVAVGPAAANGILVLAGRPAASGAVLVATWVVALCGVALALRRGIPGLPDLLVICAGVTASFTTTAVLAVGSPLWHKAFGRSVTDWSAATRWWAYGLAAAVLVGGLAGQVRLGRSIRTAASPSRPGVPVAGAPPRRGIGGLGVLMLGSLIAAAVGAAAGVAAMAWAHRVSLPPLVFVVPVTAGSYVVTRAACTRLAADPSRRIDQRNPARYAWLAGWTAVLTIGLAQLPVVLKFLLPHLHAADLAAAVAVCTVVGGVAGQLPVDRAFQWTRHQTGRALAHQAARFSAQLASAAAGLLVAGIVFAQAEWPAPTPQSIAVAVLVAGFGIVVVDLARTGTVASCIFLLLGVSAAMCAAVWVQGELDSRFETEPSSTLPLLSVVVGLTAVGIGAVYLVRFAAELAGNTKGERSNHAMSALVFAATAAGVVYAILALAA